MAWRKLIKSKIFWALIIFGIIALFDIWLHRGMIRVMNPPAFTGQRQAITGLPVCGQPLPKAGNLWKYRVQDPSSLNNLNPAYTGISVVGHFDEKRMVIWLPQKDSEKTTDLEDLLKQEQGLNTSPRGLLLAIGDMQPDKAQSFISYLNHIDSVYGYGKQIIVQTKDEWLLKNICEAGFASSYHIPFLNPYHSSEKEFLQWMDSLTETLKQNPSTYLSATYYQAPVLSKFFQEARQILWLDPTDYSVIGPMLKRRLLHDPRSYIVLDP